MTLLGCILLVLEMVTTVLKGHNHVDCKNHLGRHKYNLNVRLNKALPYSVQKTKTKTKPIVCRCLLFKMFFFGNETIGNSEVI